MKKGKRSFGKILMVLTLIFFYLPIVYMVIFSFNSGKSLTSFSGFSLRYDFGDWPVKVKENRAESDGTGQ